MPTMLSRTIAVFRWTATATIVFVALWSRLPVLEVLRCPYLEAIAVLILSSFRVKEATIRAVVLPILTHFERSYWLVSRSFPTVRLRRLRSTPIVEAHSIMGVSRAMQRQSLFRVRVKERTLTPGLDMTSNTCLVKGMLKRFPLDT